MSRIRGARWMLVVALVMVPGAMLWTGGAGFGGSILSGQDTAQEPPVAPDDSLSTGVYTPAHRSMAEAIRHFLGLRDTPVQPIDYSHQLHVQQVGLGCEFCHNGVSVSPVAGIPGVDTCLLCHTEVGRDLPEVEALVAYKDQGTEPPWVRIYGWTEEAHVRFEHRPHYIAGVECETCHGDVATMGAAERAVEHRMSFCVNCHEQAGASIDCVACHF